MRLHLYPKLAWHGICKNKKTHLPFLVTSIGLVMMYYIISYLTYSKSVYDMPGGRDLQMILLWGTAVIAIFAVIFLFYMNTFLMRRRRTEFGLYHVLGLGKWDIARILLWQTLMLLAAALIGGLGAGILLSKLAELCATNLIWHKAVLAFTIEPISIRNTVLMTVLAFGLMLLYSLGQIQAARPVELLRSEAVGERPPKARWILAIIGIVMLGVAYYLAQTTDNPLSALAILFLAVILVILATYLLFLWDSVVLCRILQKNKRYYYQTHHFVSVSSMSYRMRRSGASLASICVLSTAVLVMISTSLCLFVGTEDMLQSRYPRDLTLTAYTSDAEKIALADTVLEETLNSYGLTPQDTIRYTTFSFSGKKTGNRISLEPELTTFTDVVTMNFITLYEYQRLSGDDRTLAKGEILINVYRGSYDYDTIQIGDLAPFTIANRVENFVDLEDSMASILEFMYIVVPDQETLQEIYDYQMQVYGDNASQFQTVYSCNLDCDDEAEMAIASQVSAAITEIQSQNPDFPAYSVDSLADHRTDYYALYGGLLFLGILLSLVFLFGTVLIMYYKQIAEGYEDAGRFEILQKVGMTQPEIRRSINSQMLTVFAAPLFVAGMHLVFAFPLLQQILMLFGLTNQTLFILVTIGCFLVFGVWYGLVYRLTSRSYYQLVR